MVNVPLEQLTNRQLHLYHIQLLEDQNTHNNRMENFMSSLSQSVENLQAAVDTVAVRFASQVAPLTEALASAQAQLADLSVENEDARVALAAALTEAETAAASIDADVAELNALGAEPDVEVVPVPVEELPAPPSESVDEAPVDAPVEEAPVPDAPADEAPVDEAPAEDNPVVDDSNDEFVPADSPPIEVAPSPAPSRFDGDPSSE